MKKVIANWGNYPAMESDERLFSYDDQLQDIIRSSPHFIPAEMAAATAMPHSPVKPSIPSGTIRYSPSIRSVDCPNARAASRWTRSSK